MVAPEYKIGSGYDVHRLMSGRPLMLGGVEIKFHKGLDGHSDADVLVHAVCDAVLGAAGLGDIGEHFPDTDPQYKGVSSMVLLERCRALLRNQGYELVNLDAVVFAQAPKISPYKKQMAKNISTCLKTDETRVNIKATTTEKLGFAGKEEGIGAQCTILVQLKNNQ